jgi:hypothetical protein
VNLSRFQEGQRIAGKRDKPEEIVTKLRQVGVLQGQPCITDPVAHGVMSAMLLSTDIQA